MIYSEKKNLYFFVYSKTIYLYLYKRHIFFIRYKICWKKKNFLLSPHFFFWERGEKMPILCIIVSWIVCFYWFTTHLPNFFGKLSRDLDYNLENFYYELWFWETEKTIFFFIIHFKSFLFVSSSLMAYSIKVSVI